MAVRCYTECQACCCTCFLLDAPLLKLVPTAYFATQGVTFYRGPLIGTCFLPEEATAAVADRATGAAAITFTLQYSHAIVVSRCCTNMHDPHAHLRHTPILLHNSYSGSSAMHRIQCMCPVCRWSMRPLKRWGSRLASV